MIRHHHGVKYVIEKYKELGREFDTVALLQPTSPLRNSADIIKGYEIMKEKHANSVIAVCEAEHSPLWMNILPENHSMSQGKASPPITGLTVLYTLSRLNI